MPTLYDNFERVRQYIDQHQGGGGDMSAYVTKDELSAQSYLTSIPNTYASYNGVYSYLHSIGIDKHGNGGSFIDSSYITDSELSGDIWINGVSTWELPTYAAISNMGYLTSIPSEYVTDSELSSTLGDYYTMGEVDNEISSELRFYYTKTEINNASYVTSSDLPVIDESIIPKETGTYTLGDSSHIYSNTYSRGVYLGTGIRMFSESSASSNDMAISLGGVSYFYLNTNRFAPNGAANNEKLDLGTADRKWNHIYGKSVNVSTAYTNDMYIGSNSYLHYIDDYTFSIYLNNSERYRFFATQFYPINGNRDLGRSQNYWANTYTSNLYTNTAYLQDTSYTKSIVPAENNAYTLGDVDHLYDTTYTSKIQGLGTGLGIRLGNAGRYAFYDGAFRATDSNRNLGSSQYKWAATYTSNLYADTIHNFIWTGTSAEYAALSDYTTYQIYMIKEA